MRCVSVAMKLLGCAVYRDASLRYFWSTKKHHHNDALCGRFFVVRLGKKKYHLFELVG